jgi:predicted enzyme related to lactoylglutathione lyase
MPERTEYAPGTPSWVDLATPDLAASERFYGQLFGWAFDVQDTGDPDNPYVLATQDGKAVAGVMNLSQEMREGGMPPVWSTYVTVQDADAAVTKASELGGMVMREPMDVMNAGRMAVLADPTGAVFCIWQPNEHIGAEIVNEPNSLTWNELITPDVDTAASFYSSLFGWSPTPMAMGEGGPPYTLWMLGEDNSIGGAMPPPMEGMPPFWGVYFAVADCDATVAEAKKLGASVLAEPMDIPDVGRMAALVDPQGAVFNVIKNANPA